MRTHLGDYEDKYPNFALKRDDHGVLEIRLHTGDGPFVLDTVNHHEWGYLCADVKADPENEAVIITGTGDAFSAALDLEDPGFPAFVGSPKGVDVARWNTKRFMLATYSIDVPVITAVNGPMAVHGEIWLAADAILASQTAAFTDVVHLGGGNATGGDAPIIWEEILGFSRAKYFQFTGEVLDAATALRLGVVNEILAPDALLPRAYELGHQFAALPRVTRTASRQLIHQGMRRRLHEEANAGYGLIALSLLSGSYAQQQAAAAAAA